MAVEIDIFWSEIGSGFGESGDTPPPIIPRVTPPPPPPLWIASQSCLKRLVNIVLGAVRTKRKKIIYIK